MTKQFKDVWTVAAEKALVAIAGEVVRLTSFSAIWMNPPYDLAERVASVLTMGKVSIVLTRDVRGREDWNELVKKYSGAGFYISIRIVSGVQDFSPSCKKGDLKILCYSEREMVHFQSLFPNGIEGEDVTTLISMSGREPRDADAIIKEWLRQKLA